MLLSSSFKVPTLCLKMSLQIPLCKLSHMLNSTTSYSDLCSSVESWMGIQSLYGQVVLIFDHASKHSAYFLPKSGPILCVLLDFLRLENFNGDVIFWDGPFLNKETFNSGVTNFPFARELWKHLSLFQTSDFSLLYHFRALGSFFRTWSNSWWCYQQRQQLVYKVSRRQGEGR